MTSFPKMCVILLQVQALAWLSSPFCAACITMSSWRGHFTTCLHHSKSIYRGKIVEINGTLACVSKSNLYLHFLLHARGPKSLHKQFCTVMLHSQTYNLSNKSIEQGSNIFYAPFLSFYLWSKTLGKIKKRTQSSFFRICHLWSANEFYIMIVTITTYSERSLYV